MRGRNFITIVVSLLIIVFGTQGCALLQNAPVVELTPERLTCVTNPEMVDGDLGTVGMFQANGTVRKLYTENPGNPDATKSNYQMKHDGSLKTETLIKLDKPTYVAYIEIHAASDIPKIALDLTTEEKSPNWQNSFAPVMDKRYTRVKDREVARFYIRQDVLYLRITADGVEDRQQRKRIVSQEANFTHEIVTPLKGAKIREVKIYERM